MDLNHLMPAVQKVRTSTPPKESRAATYLRTYPALLAVASSSGVDDGTRFLQLATVAYGWMPRILRLNPDYLNGAVAALQTARVATNINQIEVLIPVVAGCLFSVVGASKVLHFANPTLFPIWDRKVERFRLSIDPSPYHMSQVRHYTEYASTVHKIRQAAGFSEFFTAFNCAFNERLSRLTISPYSLTEVRSVESAAFELAGSESDDAE